MAMNIEKITHPVSGREPTINPAENLPTLANFFDSNIAAITRIGALMMHQNISTVGSLPVEPGASKQKKANGVINKVGTSKMQLIHLSNLMYCCCRFMSVALSIR